MIPEALPYRSAHAGALWCNSPFSKGRHLSYTIPDVASIQPSTLPFSLTLSPDLETPLFGTDNPALKKTPESGFRNLILVPDLPSLLGFAEA